MRAHKGHLDPVCGGPAKPVCCGVYVQQLNRVARVAEEIKLLRSDNGPSSIRTLRQAVKRKERMENWLAAHSHSPLNPAASDSAVKRKDSAIGPRLASD